MTNDVPTIFDNGFNKALVKDDPFYNIDRIGSRVEQPAYPERLVSGELSGKYSMVDGYMQSKNFEAGVAGWKVDNDRLQVGVWNDINFSGLALGKGASAPDLVTVFGSGNIQLYGFDGGATMEQLYGGGNEILHNYCEGTDIIFHIHWTPTTNDAGNVVWQLEYQWKNVDGTFSAPTTVTATSAAGGTAWKHNKVAFAAISGADMRIGSHFVFRLFRDPAHASDTYTHDAALIGCGIHYQIDMVGSRQQTTK